MIEPIRLCFAGDGRLVRLSAMSARALLRRLVEVNRMTRHELSLFELREGAAPAIRRHEPLPGDPGDPAIAARIPLVERLQLSRTLAPRAHDCHPPNRTTRWPSLPHIAPAELRRIEGLVAARVLDGQWRLSEVEARLAKGILPGRGRRRIERVTYLPLFGAILVVEPLRASTLHASSPRDVIIEHVDRSFQFVRFEGVASARDGAGLVLRLRDRMRLDRAWTVPLDDRAESAARRWYAVRAALPQEGFAFMEAPVLA